MTSDTLRYTPCWYVIHTHPKQEDRAANNLKAWGIEIFSPKIRVQKRHPFTEELMYTSKPLFPRYIFACFKFNELYYKMRFTRGVHSLVSFDGGPTPIDEQIIEIIRSRTGSNGFVKIGEDFKTGDEVVIKSGPFQNLSGVFEREMKDSDRVRILLKAVSFQSHIVVDREMVRKVAS